MSRFIEMVKDLDHGQAVQDIDEQLAEVIQSVGDFGEHGNGELIIKLTFKRSKQRVASVDIDVKSKKPREPVATTKLWFDGEGGLRRDDPLQQELPGVRTLPKQRVRGEEPREEEDDA